MATATETKNLTEAQPTQVLQGTAEPSPETENLTEA
jgi:hypothetical protein